MTFGVTGGCGFIGSHMSRLLSSLGHRVIVIDDFSTGSENNIAGTNCEIFTFDICKDDFSVLPRPDGVFHLAARARIQPSLAEPELTMHVNVHGTVRLLEAVRAVNPGARVIFASSSSIYGDGILPNVETADPRPLNPYALSKLMGEQAMKQWSDNFGLRTVSLRLFNVYGDQMIESGRFATVLGILVRLAKEGGVATVNGDGHQRRDFTHVDDVVDGFWKAYRLAAARGEVINIGRGNNLSIMEIVKLAGLPHRFSEALPREAPSTLADNGRARELLGWTPTRDVEDFVRLRTRRAMIRHVCHD